MDRFDDPPERLPLPSEDEGDLIDEPATGESDDPMVANALNEVALLYKAQGQYAQAEPLYKRALAIREKALGPDHPDVAQSLNNLADLYSAQGRHADAEPLYKRALGSTAVQKGRTLGS